MNVRVLLRVLVTGVTAAVVVAGLPPGTATAATSGKVVSRSATLYEDCFSHPFSYALSDVGEGWSLTVTLVAASGRVVDRAVVPASEGTSGRGAFRLCASSVRPGTFAVRSHVTWPAEAGRSALALATSRLTLRRPTSKTTITRQPRRPRVGSRLRIRTTVTVARPYGRFPRAGVRVVAQVRRNGAWRRLAPARYTNAKGVATFKVRWRAKSPRKIRVTTVRTRYYERSTSRVVKVRSRGKD
ncbi:hypothetical protein FE697_019485 [Mumia zhuanghuii]|uniref:Big-1 domain-containing protein n=2 Tax=Mumia TaxID=1546255 RepID=A0ABW1QN19_9ACTN|nr:MULTISPECIES: hypothetical protein [Mumia]KAA1420063.1 hypothetical protein FE697_019485 [Mumia zhuanghuii]